MESLKKVLNDSKKWIEEAQKIMKERSRAGEFVSENQEYLLETSVHKIFFITFELKTKLWSDFEREKGLRGLLVDENG